jgi:hypothetical protein
VLNTTAEVGMTAGGSGSAPVNVDWTVATPVSLLPSIVPLNAGPSVVQVRTVPTSGGRKKFSAAFTVDVEAPPRTLLEMYPLAGAVAVIDE